MRQTHSSDSMICDELNLYVFLKLELIPSASSLHRALIAIFYIKFFSIFTFLNGNCVGGSLIIIGNSFRTFIAK